MKLINPVFYLKGKNYLLESLFFTRQKNELIKELDFFESDTLVSTYYTLAMAETASNLSRLDGTNYGARIEGDNLKDTYSITRSENFSEETDIYAAVDSLMPHAKAISAKCFDFFSKRKLLAGLEQSMPSRAHWISKLRRRKAEWRARKLCWERENEG